MSARRRRPSGRSSRSACRGRTARSSCRRTRRGAIALRGRVLDGAGEPVPDALIETWQADPDGRFDHPDDPRGRGRGLPRLRALPDRRRRELADRDASSPGRCRVRTACRRRRTSPSRCSRAACSTASSRGSTSATSPRRTPPTRCSPRLGGGAAGDADRGAGRRWLRPRHPPPGRARDGVPALLMEPLFGPLFAPARLREAVSARAWVAAMLEAEAALAAAEAEAGVIPAAAAAAIARRRRHRRRRAGRGGRRLGHAGRPARRGAARARRRGACRARAPRRDEPGHRRHGGDARRAPRAGARRRGARRRRARLRGARARARRHRDGGPDAAAAGAARSRSG